MTHAQHLDEIRRPLVAILRGLRPENAVATGRAIFDAGIEAIEVPLNSPDPFASIAMLVEALPDALIGAGTVLTTDDVDRLVETGAGLLVTPNCEPAIIEAAVRRGLVALPGCFTATEALAALRAGAHGLKIFPASVMGPDGIAALRAVLPPDTFVAAVGGVGHDDFAAYIARGVTAFGLGSSLFKPDWSVERIGEQARRTVAAYDDAMRDVDA